MFLITLAEKGGGNQQQLTFKKAEVTIGRLAGNDIVLGKGNVSKYHSRIVLKDGKFNIGDYIINVEASEGGEESDAQEEEQPDDAEAQGDGEEQQEEEQQEEEQ